jgi:peroxiredoxin
LRGWHEQYVEEGLVVIGNHYPEFSYEEDLDNLKEAITELEISYPVAQDNEGKTWRAYQNRYWPTLYLIGKQGNIRYVHIGEGHYTETEAAIQALLNEPYP